MGKDLVRPGSLVIDVYGVKIVTSIHDIRGNLLLDLILYSFKTKTCFLYSSYALEACVREKVMKVIY